VSRISQPVMKVNMAPQRNHQSAFGTSPRTIALRAVPPSSLPKKGVWTRLKYQSIPIQAIPARKWNQRSRKYQPSMLKISMAVLLSGYAARRRVYPQSGSFRRANAGAERMPGTGARCA
jgi:hypothetical protein